MSRAEAPQVRIERVEDPRVDRFRALRDRNLVRDDAFVVEGRLNVRTLVLESDFEVESLFVTPTAFAALPDVVDALASRAPVYVAEPPVLSGVVGYDLHRGCVASALRSPLLALDELAAHGGPLVLLEDLTDNENVGTAFRNALALGARGIVLSPRCCDPLYRRSVRISMGAALRVPFARARVWPDALDDLRRAGFRVAALDPGIDAQSVEVLELEDPSRVALVVGTEGAGLSAALLERADLCLRIPMAAGVDSLNVSTALAIALHRLGAAPCARS